MFKNTELQNKINSIEDLKEAKELLNQLAESVDYQNTVLIDYRKRDKDQMQKMRVLEEQLEFLKGQK